MRKSLKKLCAIALASTMAVGMAACGNDGQEESSGNEQQSSGTPSDESSAAGDDGGSASGEIDREPITITVSTILPQKWNDYPDNSVAKYIREKFGITIEVIDISERKEALMASGDLPDIFIIESNEVLPLIESGFILPLDDLLAKYDAAQYFYPPNKIEEVMDFQRREIFKSDHIYGLTGGYSEAGPDARSEEHTSELQ